jgi:hypothetical protein
MKSMGKCAGQVAAGVLLVVLAGCPNSDVVVHDSGQLVLEFQTVGTAGRYDNANLLIRQITYRPADSDVDGSLGGEPLGLLSFALTVNLNANGIVEYPIGAPAGTSYPLSPGVYNLEQITIDNFTLQDTPPLEPLDNSCAEMLPALTTLTSSPSQSLTAELPFDPPASFVVGETGATTIRITIDVPGLVDVLKGGFISCRETSNCTNPSRPPPCFTAFVTPDDEAFSPVITASQAQ